MLSGLIVGVLGIVLNDIVNHILKTVENFLIFFIFNKLRKSKLVKRIINAFKNNQRRYPIRNRRRPDFYGHVITH